MENECLDNFVSALTSIPHIADNIVERISLSDVANCLRTCKGLRKLVKIALNNSKILIDLEDELSRSLVTNETLTMEQHGPLERGFVKTSKSDKNFCFGFDGNLWISNKCINNEYPTLDNLNLGCSLSDNSSLGMSFTDIMTVYDLNGNNQVQNIGLELEWRPRVKISPSNKILLQDDKRQLILSKEANESNIGVMHENILAPIELDVCPKDFYGGDCTFKIEMEDNGEFPWKLTFNGTDGHLMSDTPVTMKNPPGEFIVQKGQHVMFGDPRLPGFSLVDTAIGGIIWSQEVNPLFFNKHYIPFLTESFYGFMSYEWHYRLMIFDTSTGEEIINEICWHVYMGSVRMHPVVIASGNYLLACATQGGRYSKEISHELSNTLICIKVDPETHKFDVKRTCTGWELALLAKALQDEKEICSTMKSQPDTKLVSVNNCEILCDTLRYLGFASESVVICQVKFDYRGVRAKFKGVKTLFTIDLDKILTMEEPAGVFAAVHFPLKSNILENAQERLFPHQSTYFTQEPEFYPYYQSLGPSTNKEVRLVGAVEISKCKNKPMMPKLYSFRKSLEAKDLSARANEFGYSAKHAKLQDKAI